MTTESELLAAVTEIVKRDCDGLVRLCRRVDGKCIDCECENDAAEIIEMVLKC